MDPAILAAFDYPLPPISPLMVEERVLLTPQAEKTDRLAKQAVASYAGYIESWKRNIANVQAKFPTQVFNAKSSELAAKILEVAEEVEAFAEERAKILEQFQKRTKRDVKKTFQRNPSLGAVKRTLANDLQRLDEEVIEELLQFSLWIRAARTFVDPTASGGPTFESARDLAKYLARETA